MFSDDTDVFVGVDVLSGGHNFLKNWRLIFRTAGILGQSSALRRDGMCREK